MEHPNCTRWKTSRQTSRTTSCASVVKYLTVHLKYKPQWKLGYAWGHKNYVHYANSKQYTLFTFQCKTTEYTSKLHCKQFFSLCGTHRKQNFIDESQHKQTIQWNIYNTIKRFTINGNKRPHTVPGDDRRISPTTLYTNNQVSFLASLS